MVASRPAFSVLNFRQGGKQIELLASEIGELQASSGKLSTENAGLEATMGDNERARNTAQSLRDKANEDFKAEEEDMVNAIGQMDQANEDFKAEEEDMVNAIG